MAMDDSEPIAGSDDRSTGERIAEDLSTFTQLHTSFYRGEVDRTTVWRARLDQTTNWAVVVVAAILTWAFSSPNHPHYVVLIGVFGVTAFLVMEANRYREYDVWRDRVRTLQTNLVAEAYAPDGASDADWRAELGEDLRRPTFGVSFWEALTHRLRRSYMALLLLLLAAWIARVALLEPAEPWQRTASVPGIPGWIVALVVGGFYAGLLALTVWSAHGDRVREFNL